MSLIFKFFKCVYLFFCPYIYCDLLSTWKKSIEHSFTCVSCVGLYVFLIFQLKVFYRHASRKGAVNSLHDAIRRSNPIYGPSNDQNICLHILLPLLSIRICRLKIVEVYSKLLYKSLIIMKLKQFEFI